MGRPKGSKNKKTLAAIATTATVSTENNVENTPNSTPSYANDVRETCITHCSGDGFLDFYSSETWGRNFAKRMLEEHPEDCTLNFEDPDGYAISIKMPWEGMKYIKYPVKRNITDEQREAARVRMAEARKKKGENKGEE